MNPEPQKFLLDLIKEVVVNYEIDGIQGDDRLPAMPSEGGYDDFTKKLYFDDFGNELPLNSKDENWLKWRADKLSEFGKTVYNSVKKIDPDVTVSWAPSIYPWALREYLQDWPKWLKEGYADFIIPQFYRRNIEDYKKIIYNSKKILSEAIKKGGSSIKNFRNLSGASGNFQKNFKVYEREGLSCKRYRCKGLIKKKIISNRSTFFCNSCQK